MNQIQQFSVDGKARIGISTFDINGETKRFFWWKNHEGTSAQVAAFCGTLLAFGINACVRSGIDMCAFNDSRRVSLLSDVLGVYIEEGEWVAIRSADQEGRMTGYLAEHGRVMNEGRSSLSPHAR